MMVDPAVSLILFLSFAAMWLISGADKLRNLRRFEAALSAYDLLPSKQLLRPAAYSIALIELAMGVLAVARWTGTGPSSAILLLIYSAAVGVNLFRGRRGIDCGCSFSRTSPLRISEWLIARNLLLASLGFAMVLPVGPRAMAVGDALTVAAGVAIAGLFYQAANQLAATWGAPWSTSIGLAADHAGGR